MLPDVHGHLGRSAPRPGGTPGLNPSGQGPLHDVLAALFILCLPMMVLLAPGQVGQLADAESVD